MTIDMKNIILYNLLLITVTNKVYKEICNFVCRFYL